MRLRYVAPLGLWLAAAVLTSLAEGTPDPLPTVALGSTALYDAGELRETKSALAELQGQVGNHEAVLGRAKQRLDALESEP